MARRLGCKAIRARHRRGRGKMATGRGEAMTDA